MTYRALLLHTPQLICVAIAASITAQTLYLGLGLLPEIPWEDGWKTAILLSRDDSLTISELFAQHNEHRILLTHLIDLADLYIVGGRNLFHFAVAIAATAAQAAAIGWLATHESHCSRDERIALYSLSFGALFSLPQIELFFWPFAVGNILSSLFVVLTLAALSQVNKLSSSVLMIGAMATGTLAVFGLASGLLVWPIGLLVLVACEKKITRKSLAWLAAGLIVCFLYFQDYTRPTYHADPGQAILQHPADFLAFFLIIMGSLVGAHGIAIAAAAGGALAAGFWSAFASLLESFAKPPQTLSALFGITAFSCLSAAAAASSRINFGLEHALSSRYTVISALSFACIFSSNFILKHRAQARLRVPITVAGILLIILSLPAREINRFADASAKMNSASIAIALHIDDIEMAPWNTKYHTSMLKALKFFEEKHVSVFHGDGHSIGQPILGRFRLIPASRCTGHLDGIDPVPGDTNAVRASGWAWLTDAQKLPERIALVDEDKRIVGWAAENWSRPDVPETITQNRRSGWLGYARALPGTVLHAFAVNEVKDTACPLQ